MTLPETIKPRLRSLSEYGGDIMAKEATLQVRMDADLKEEAEKLYRDMGTSLAEAD